jgi:hypothetical protein
MRELRDFWHPEEGWTQHFPRAIFLNSVGLQSPEPEPIVILDRFGRPFETQEPKADISEGFPSADESTETFEEPQ